MAAVIKVNTIAVPVSVASGAGTDVSMMAQKTVTLQGVVTATYQLQINLDPAALAGDASWVNEGTALTADGSLEVTKPCCLLRWKCTAYTGAATPVGRVNGFQR